MSEAEFEATTHYYDLGGGQVLFYRDYRPSAVAEATPVLFLPGFWRNSKDFEAIAELLAPSRRVIVPDLRGRGLSSRSLNVGDYHFEQLIADVWALLDTIGAERVVVGGTALGAFMAIEMAHRCAARIGGVILNDAGTETTPPASKRVNAQVDHDEWTLDDVVEKTKRLNGAFFADFSDDDWIRFSLQAYRQSESGGYVRDFDALTSEETARFKREKHSFWEEYKSLSMPVALLRGQHSDYLPAELAERMVSANANAALTEIPSRGHPLILNEPQAVAAIRRLLAAADKTSPQVG